MSPKERHVELDKTTIHVVDSARRGLLPIVAVHGFPGADHMSLRATPGFENLAAQTRMVYYDLRGAGHTGGWDADVTPSFSRHATDLTRLIATMNLDRPILIGHYSGGCIALRAALEQPASVSGVVLACPRPTGGACDRHGFEAKVAEMLEEVDVTQLLTPGDHEPDVAFRKAMDQIFPLGFLRFGLSERTFMKRVAFRRQTYDDLWTAATDSDLAARLGDLRVPVLVLAGRYDPFVDLSLVREMAAGIPGARFHLFHDAAHWPFLEEPESFADEIWSWMEEVAAHIV